MPSSQNYAARLTIYFPNSLNLVWGLHVPNSFALVLRAFALIRRASAAGRGPRASASPRSRVSGLIDIPDFAQSDSDGLPIVRLRRHIRELGLCVVSTCQGGLKRKDK